MSQIREAIITEARKWIGTPYVDGQRCRGAGADCIQLVIGVGEAVGLGAAVGLQAGERFETPYYSPQWHLHQNDEMLLRQLDFYGCVEKSLEDRLAGDILVFEFGRVCSHCALLLPDDVIIHALYGRRVLDGKLLGIWRNTLRHCYVFPGVE